MKNLENKCGGVGFCEDRVSVEFYAVTGIIVGAAEGVIAGYCPVLMCGGDENYAVFFGVGIGVLGAVCGAVIGINEYDNGPM